MKNKKNQNVKAEEQNAVFIEIHKKTCDFLKNGNFTARLLIFATNE